VTQGQWKKVMGTNPSYYKLGDEFAVYSVSWEDVQEFIKKLNEMEGTPAYRLPTEAEWEYACRAGSTTAFYNGHITKPEGDDPNLDKIGWYYANSHHTFHPVAQKIANAWGLYDMSGNEDEWCQDLYGNLFSKPVTDPYGPLSGTYRVIRGGSFNSRAMDCRSAVRGFAMPGNRHDSQGVRIVKAAQ